MNPGKLTSIWIFIAATHCLQAQQVLSWSKYFDQDMNLKITDIQSHDSNVFVAGIFNDSLVLSGKALYSEGENDIFLAGLSYDGTVKWAKKHGGSGNEALSKLTQQGERLFLAGSITNDAVPGTGQEKSPAFLQISSWDFEGTMSWHIDLEYTNYATTDVLSAGPEGTLIAGGMYLGNLRINEDILFSSAERRAYFLIISAEGRVLEAWSSQGKGQHRAIASCFDQQGSIYSLCATTSGTFIPGSSVEEPTLEFTSNGIAITKSDNNTDHLWSIPVTGSGFIEGVELICDNDRGILLSINFSNGINVCDTTMHSASQLASAVISFSHTGKLRWASTIESSEYCRIKDMTVMNDNTVVITGYYFGKYSYNNVEVSSGTSPGKNTFLISIDQNGTLTWHEEVNQENDYCGRAVAISEEGNILLAGGYKYIPQKSSGTQKSIIDRNGMYIHCYHNCEPFDFGLEYPPGICTNEPAMITADPGFESYLWNDTLWAGNRIEVCKPGIYSVEAFDKQGCSSRVTITIEEKPLMNDSHGPEIVILPKEATVLSADNSLTEHPCCDFYPNPVNDFLFLNCRNDEPEKWFVQVFDTWGVRVYTGEYQLNQTSSSLRIDLSALSRGAYTVKVMTGSKVINRKIIKN